MKLFPQVLSLVALVAWTSVGCSKVDRYEVDVSTNPAKAAAAIEKTYANGTPAMKAAAAELASALKKKDYEKATVSLLTLRSLPENSDQQMLFLRGVMASLQLAIADAIDKGDPSAVNAREIIKGSRF